jgi:hypothetical protein
MFSIVSSFIIEKDTAVPVKLSKIREIQPALVQRYLPFGFIPVQYHNFNIHTLNDAFKTRVLQQFPHVLAALFSQQRTLRDRA